MAGIARDRAKALLTGFGDSPQSEGELSPSKQQKSRYQSIWSLFVSSGMGADEQRGFIRNTAISCALAALGCFLVKPAFTPIVVIVVAVIQYLRLKGKIAKRVEAFERDYPTFLLSLASAVRTGLDPIQAFTDAANLFSDTSELKKELLITKERLEAGSAEEAAVRNFAKTISHPDIDLFRTGFILARKEGSSLGECLERLARVTRARQTFRRKIRSAVAMQKLSAIGVGGCALLVVGIQFVSNPETFSKILADQYGRVFLAIGVCLVIGGIVWMFRMARGRV